jgi:hypothetical protein
MPVKRWRAQLAERELAKSAEMTAAGVKASARTVRLMRYRYRELGTGRRPACPAGNVDPRVVAAAAAVIDAQTGASTGTQSWVIGQVRQWLDDEYGPGVVPVPSRAPFYRLLQVLSAVALSCWSSGRWPTAAPVAREPGSGLARLREKTTARRPPCAGRPRPAAC